MAERMLEAFSPRSPATARSQDGVNDRPTSGDVPSASATSGPGRSNATTTAQTMLTFAQRQYLEEQPTDLNVVVNTLDDLIRQMVGRIDVHFNLSGRAVCAKLDVEQLELALLALVQNAADATSAGGSITITTRHYSLDEATSGNADVHWVELSVSDRGHGMSAEVARRAAEPFFTTKPNGTGMGLSMTQGFVEQSGGRIEIETIPGHGTTVRVSFHEHVRETSD